MRAGASAINTNPIIVKGNAYVTAKSGASNACASARSYQVESNATLIMEGGISGISTGSNVTIINNGAMTVTTQNGYGINASNLTYSGIGTLTVEGAGSSSGINLSGGMLTISSGTIKVTGGTSGKAITLAGALPKIVIGTGTLEIKNNGTVETHTFEMESIGDPWSVTGTGVTHTGQITDNSIDVTIPAISSGIVTRAVIASINVCAIDTTEYPTLDAALAAVTDSTPTTIKLLVDITHNSPIVISNKTITFDLSSYSLLVDTTAIPYSSALKIENSGSVGYTGSNSFVVNGYSYGIYMDGGTASITSAFGENANVDSYGAYVENGGELTLAGNAMGSSRGAYAESAGKITIGGNAIATAPTPYNSFGAQVKSGGIITIAGNAEAEDRGISVNGPGSKITVGNVISRGTGIRYGRAAVQVESLGQAFILGNCTINCIGGIAVFVSSNGEVTIDGIINHNGKYIEIYTTEFDGSPTSRTIPTTKAGYYTYSTENGIVWVKDTSVVALPNVQTNSITNVTATGATLSGIVISDGGAAVTERGFVIGTSLNPAIGTGTQMTSGSGIGNLSEVISGLTPNTTYYVRVYAVNSAGTVYGENMSFTTIPIVIPPTVPPNVTATSGNDTPSQPMTIVAEKLPNIPTLTTVTLKGKPNKKGLLTETITEQMVKDAFSRAETEAKGLGRQDYGVSISFTNSKAGVKSLRVKIDEAAMKWLQSSGIKFCEVKTGIFYFSLNDTAISELESNTKGTVIFTATPVTKLSKSAKATIGKRPVFDFVVKDGSGKVITNYGKGTIQRGIKYTASKSEKRGSLLIVKIVDGKVQWIDKSSYNNGWVIWSGNSNSVYGVGYKLPDSDFSDIANHWAMNDIDYVTSRGLIIGTSESTFSPNNAITHADFLMALGKLYGVKVSDYKKSSFTDIKDTDPAMPYIEWAIKSGIVQGIGSKQFSPNRNITREQMAVIMMNYTKVIKYTLPVSRQAITFTDDANISGGAKDAVYAIHQTGVISSKSNNLFGPQDNITRAEASAILHRFIELVINERTTRGWVQINEKWYYFYPDGKLATNTTIDGYIVGEDGARKQ